MLSSDGDSASGGSQTSCAGTPRPCSFSTTTSSTDFSSPCGRCAGSGVGAGASSSGVSGTSIGSLRNGSGRRANAAPGPAATVSRR